MRPSGRISRGRKSRYGIAALAITALLAGCSSSTKTTSAANTKTTSAANTKTGVGVTAKTITLGAYYTTGRATTTKGLGIKGQGYPQGLREAKGVAAYINANGGIAGRHLNVVYFRGLDKPVSRSAQGVSACDFFTETNHVFAVLDPGSPPPSAMVTCLAAHNTPLVSANDAVPNQAYYNQYRNIYYSPEGMALNQIAVSYVQGLKSEGFFSSAGAKYGVITANVPLWETVTKTNLLPALSKIGVKPLAVEYVAGLNVSGFAVHMPSVVLRFKQLGINHVLWIEHGSGIGINFIQDAASQKYFPTEGIYSYNYPRILRINHSAADLANTEGIGFIQYDDVASAQMPPYNASMKQCLSIMHKIGETKFAPQDLYTYGGWCDTYFFTQAAAQKAPTFTTTGFREGVDSLGTSWQSAVSQYTSFGPGKHWGVDGYRLLKFEMSCKCYQYTGPLVKLHLK